MKKSIVINGETFEVIKPRKYVKRVEGSFGLASDIYLCYDRPSTRKVSIWESWLNWANEIKSHFDKEIGLSVFHINSYNCNFFTITGLYIEDGKVYNLYITPAHNRAYLLN